MNTERIQRYLVPYYLKLLVNAVNLVLGFLAHKKLALNAVKYITVKHYKVLTLNGGCTKQGRHDRHIVLQICLGCQMEIGVTAE